MSKIVGIIQESNFELVRSRIASILADEIANQITLNQTALDAELAKPESEQDPVLIASLELNLLALPSKVWEERFFRLTASEIQKEVLINVKFNSAPLDELTTGSTQLGDDSYSIEVYAGSESNKDNRGDYRATLKLQRTLAIVRSILMNPNYVNLGFDTTYIIGKRVCNNIQMGSPDNGADNADSMTYGSIGLTVKITEGVEAITGIPLALSETTVKIDDSEKGYYWTNLSN